MARPPSRKAEVEKVAILRMQNIIQIGGSERLRKELKERLESSKVTMGYLEKIKESVFDTNENVRERIKPIEIALRKCMDNLEALLKSGKIINDGRLLDIHQTLDFVRREIKTLILKRPIRIQDIGPMQKEPQDDQNQVKSPKSESDIPFGHDAVRTMLTKQFWPSTSYTGRPPSDDVYDAPNKKRHRCNVVVLRSITYPDTSDSESDDDDEDDDEEIVKEEGDMIVIGTSGNTKVLKTLFNNLKTQKYNVMTRYLMNNLFSRESLAAFSMSGRASPTLVNNKKIKKTLDNTTVNDIIKCVSRTASVHPRYVRFAFRAKCEDEYKMLKLRTKILERRRRNLENVAESERK